VRIDGRVIRNTKCLEGFRFHWKESNFVGRNQVSLEEIRFHWKDSGFIGRNQVSFVALQIWRDDGTITNELVVGYICLGRFGCIMEQVSQCDNGCKCCI
jgi:hypothetical protein